MTEYTEERLARRLVQRHGLKPRIPIDEIAALYANVESIVFPVSVDGVSLHLKSPVRRPDIMINSSQPPRRWRFTLAHELGHVLIPGHVGSIVDDTDLANDQERSRYREKEAEANRFAAELLMPSEWARSLIGTPTDMAARVLRLSNEADVSLDAAMFKALKLGPPGYIVARTISGKIVWSDKTEGTRSNKPTLGSAAVESSVHPVLHHTTYETSGSVIHWWRESIEAAIPSAPTQTWREILNDIMSDLTLVNENKAIQSINGIIAVANGSVRASRTCESIYASCLHNVRNRNDDNSDVASIINHPRFGEFLIARAHSFRI